MNRYQWREGIPKPKVEADVFGGEVERIAQLNGGIVKPGDIVAAASEFGSPIADLFDWIDERAAHKFRVVQARSFLGALQTVRVQVEHGPTISTRGFHRVRQGDRSGYASESMVMGDRELKRQVINSASRELKSFINRFKAIASMGTYIARLQDVADEMADEIERLEVEASSRRPQAVRTEAQPAQSAAA